MPESSIETPSPSEFHDRPIESVDVVIALIHAHAPDIAVLSGRDVRALQEAADWLGRSPEHALLAETLQAIHDSYLADPTLTRATAGIQERDIHRLQSIFLDLDRQPLALAMLPAAEGGA